MRFESRRVKMKKNAFCNWKNIFSLQLYFCWSLGFAFQRWFVKLEKALLQNFKSLKMEKIWEKSAKVFSVIGRWLVMGRFTLVLLRTWSIQVKWFYYLNILFYFILFYFIFLESISLTSENWWSSFHSKYCLKVLEVRFFWSLELILCFGKLKPKSGVQALHTQKVAGFTSQ
jgi:hypothetical protein